MQLDPSQQPSRCANEDDQHILPCYQKLFEEVSGITFDGVTDRVLPPGKAMLSHSVGGFNNHMCGQEHLSWGWDPLACYEEGETTVLHTKNSTLGVEELRDCRAVRKINEEFIQAGTLMVLPDSDKLCYLEDKGCRQRASKYINVPPAA